MLLVTALAWPARPVCADPPVDAPPEGGSEAEQASDVRSTDDADTSGSRSAYARIIVETTPMRSGPGPGFRQVGSARRGQVYPIRQRATRGYWFEIERPDATRAWVLGDAVYVLDDRGEESRFMPRLFAPPPLPDAHAEVAMVFGVFGGGGFMAVRPSVLFSPAAGLELTAAIRVARAGSLLVGALGGIINLAPSSPIVPYVVAGGGVGHSRPNADTFLLDAGSVGLFYGGGGLRFGFRQRLIVRLEVRSYALIEPDRYVTEEEYSGGLSVFF